MNDRELLELAAKAARMADATYCELSGDAPAMHVKDYGVWDPLGDDGDALRLAVNLDIDIQFNTGEDEQTTTAIGLEPDDTTRSRGFTCTEAWGADKCAATRRAITRATAEIGAGMRPFPTVEEIHQMVGTEAPGDAGTEGAQPSRYLITSMVDAYYAKDGNETGGSLHIVLDDFNFRDSDVKWCREFAAESGDDDGVFLADVLLKLTEEERRMMLGSAQHLNEDQP